MNPNDVPAEWADKAADEILAASFGQELPEPPDYLARHALAAVLPDARHAAKVDAVTEARMVISQYLATAEKWRYDRVMWAFAIMLGELPEDTPEPESPADVRLRAARLTATTEEPTP